MAYCVWIIILTGNTKGKTKGILKLQNKWHFANSLILVIFHSEPNIEGLDIQRNQRWEWPPPPRKKRRSLNHTPQKWTVMNKEVCNMAFSYLLFQWEGVVWPVLPEHLKSTNILAGNSLENKRQWARHPGSWMRKIYIYWTFSDDKPFIHK